MLDYIENSGGKDYPFYQKGRILRVATIEDLNKQSQLDVLRKECVKYAKAQVAELNLPMKLVEAEPILGGEQITFYYMSEDRVDFRDLVNRLAGQFRTRIEMRQVGARDEARLVADYERCGQHCCCKNFLKVLKPVSMRAAKVQKATLDPLKISGRCGRLMCCLRYEDQTYKELKANLPPRNKRVGTSEGPGVVIDSKILVQLVLVRLEHDMKEIAVPIEELMDPETCPKPGEMKKKREQEAYESDPLRGLSEEQVVERTDDSRRRRPRGEGKIEGGGKERGGRSKNQQQDAFRKKSKRQERGSAQEQPEGQAPAGEGGGQGGGQGQQGGGRGQRRGRRPPQQARPQQPPTGDSLPPSDGASDGASPNPPEASGEGGGPKGHKKRRRRRRRRGGGGPNKNEGGGPPPDSSPQ
jgi:cell fate regulator YaaT (PSP1 superfamily)